MLPTYIRITHFLGSCGGDFKEASGHLSSPSYPREYPAHTDCLFTISLPEETFLKLDILNFGFGGLGPWRLNISVDKWRVGDDYLEIRDGDSDVSPLIGKFFGENIPHSLQSTQNKLWIRYYRGKVQFWQKLFNVR